MKARTPKRSAPPEPEPKIAYLEQEDCFVNLNGDYTYLCTGYYLSQDVEVSQKPVRPTCKETLDAYIVPLCLEKAKQAGLPVADYYITSDYFETPVVIDPINPFMDRQRVVTRPGQQVRVAKSLTRNFTYAICCQDLPPHAKVGHFRSVMGWSTSHRYRTLAALVWEVFHMPLATVRVIALDEENVLLSRLKTLPFERLTARELEHIHRVVKWQT